MSETTPNPATADRIRNALRTAQSKLAAAERARTEPIAVVAMACRFPGGADTPAALWHKLRAGDDLTCDYPAAARGIPESLFAAGAPIYTRRGGFLRNVDLFDAAAFHLSPREAEALDPQQRLVLEVSREALHQAHLDPDQLRGTATGVFVGMGQNDYGRHRFHADDLTAVDAYDGTGNLACFASGRLGFTLGLQGPNLVVDTACSSALVALHLACQSLRAGECALALAGGVHVALAPEVFVFLCRTGALSPNGVCRAFDAGADGFVRGEGCGMLLLKRLSDAERDGDTVLATVRGSAVNHDGPSGGLTVPNENAQEQLVRQALQRAKVNPEQIGYLEAHGTGTALGDPIEVSALAAVFTTERTEPLYLGSVKTNMGHLESAAGMAGVFKTILMMQHGEIVPHLHLDQPNPAIAWSSLPFRLTGKCLPWPKTSGPRLAGVSAFGMSGTNAHVVLQGPDADRVAPALQNETHFPFQRERYWLQPPDPTRTGNTENTLAPTQLALPLSNRQRFQWRLAPTRQPYLADHRVFDKLVVPGANHLVLMLCALQQVRPQVAPRLQDVFFQQALILDDERLVQVLLEPEDGADQVTLLSRSAADAGAPWLVHMTARALHTNTPAPTVPNAAELRASCANHLAGERLNADLAGAGFDLGPTFQWNQQFHHNDDTWLCDLATPPGDTNHAPLPIHPGLLDSCFQMLSLFWPHPPATLAEQPFLYVPFRIDELILHQTPSAGERWWCVGRRQAETQLLLCNDLNQALVSVRGFAFRRAERANLFAKPSDAHLVYRLKRQAQDAAVAVQRGARYLSFVNADPVADALHSEAQTRGAQLIRITATTRFDASHADHISLNPFSPEHWTRLFAKHPAADFDGVIFAWGLQADSDREPDGNDLLDGELDAGEAALHLVRALAQSDGERRPRLLFACRAGFLQDRGEAFIPRGAGLWGLARCIALELADWAPISVDLAPEPAPAMARRLLDEIARNDGEDQISYSNGRRYVLRLLPQPNQARGTQQPSLHGNRTYLVTGAFGGLGQRLTAWLIAQGARHLILCGRREPDAEARLRLTAWRDEGVSFHLTETDIGRADEVRELCQSARTRMPPLAGVFHAAGVIDDHAVLTQTRAALARVFHPKLLGAWHLHQETRNEALDWFVCFSSSAAVFGSRGQAGYAAANAWLDALTDYRTRLGLHALSVNWGAWRGAGMADRLDLKQQQKLHDMGLDAMSADQALGVLGDLLRQGTTRALVGAYHPAKLRRHFFHGKAPALLGDWGRETPVAERKPQNTALQNADPSQRATLLNRLLRQQIAAVLKLKAADQLQPRQRLFDIGLDSIMAMELQRALETELALKLRATLIFDFPTLEALHRHLLDKLAPAEKAPAPPTSQPTTRQAGPSLFSDIRAMTTQDLLDQLKRGPNP